MAGLLDSIRQQLGSTDQAAAAQAPQLGQTAQVQGLLRAKLGKSTSETGTPAATSIGEQTAQQQTNLGLQQIGQQGQLTAQQLGQSQVDIQQKVQQQQVTHQQNTTAIQQQAANQASSILDNLAASGKQLGTSQKQAQMEQAGFLIRGQNSNYVQQLQRQGQLNRLQNTGEFKYNLAKDVFSDEQDLFKNDLQFKTAMNSNDRDFNQGLQNMSNNFAIEMANRAFQNQAAQSRFTGMSGTVGAGLGAASVYQNQQNASDAQSQREETDFNNEMGPL